MLRLAHPARLVAFAALATAPAQAQWTVEHLSQARGRATSASVGDLVLFAGGEEPATPMNFGDVDFYYAATNTWAPDMLSSVRSRVAGASVGPLMLFAGGGVGPGSPSDVVDVYDTQTMTWGLMPPLSAARGQIAATTVGSKVIFAGGSIDPMTASDVVDMYDHQTGTWSQTTLSQARYGLVAATAGDLAIFAGGFVPGLGVVETVDIFDNSTGTWTVSQLSQARSEPAAVAVGTRAYFAGGTVFPGPGGASDVIDIYDAQTGLWTQDTLPEARFELKAAALGNTLIFASGGDTLGNLTTTVHMFNVGTGHWDSNSDLSLGRYVVSAASAAGKALFAGGLWQPVGNSLATDVVDVYEPTGINYCLAAANSAGCAATISATGSKSLSANDVVLSSICVPDAVFIFFHGTSQQELPFGNGTLCVGGNIVRILPPGVGSGGLAQAAIDLPTVGITTPGQRNFQCWFRDPAAGGASFDTSDAIAITFVP